MEDLIEFAYEMLRSSWMTDKGFHGLTKKHIKECLIPQDIFLKKLIPKNTPFAKQIHKERILYDLFMDDAILVFRQDDGDTESFYSNSEQDESSADTGSFLNGTRILNESDQREQLSANEFTGGQWEPADHWVLVKEDLRKEVQKQSPRLIKIKVKKSAPSVA